jgi:hypothetical protein
MCHEEIHRRARLDLADRDPDARPDCKRSPRVPVELFIRQQRLLTISGAERAFRLAARDLPSQSGRLALASGRLAIVSLIPASPMRPIAVEAGGTVGDAAAHDGEVRT